MKKVTIGAKPTAQPGYVSPDDWVSNRKGKERTKRLTIDVSFALHQRMKSRCALDGKNMSDVVRDLLEQHFMGA